MDEDRLPPFLRGPAYAGRGPGARNSHSSANPSSGTSAAGQAVPYGTTTAGPAFSYGTGSAGRASQGTGWQDSSYQTGSAQMPGSGMAAPAFQGSGWQSSSYQTGSVQMPGSGMAVSASHGAGWQGSTSQASSAQISASTMAGPSGSGQPAAVPEPIDPATLKTAVVVIWYKSPADIRAENESNQDTDWRYAMGLCFAKWRHLYQAPLGDRRTVVIQRPAIITSSKIDFTTNMNSRYWEIIVRIPGAPLAVNKFYPAYKFGSNNALQVLQCLDWSDKSVSFSVPTLISAADTHVASRPVTFTGADHGWNTAYRTIAHELKDGIGRIAHNVLKQMGPSPMSFIGAPLSMQGRVLGFVLDEVSDNRQASGRSGSEGGDLQVYLLQQEELDAINRITEQHESQYDPPRQQYERYY